jgi:heme/copper-type cytochrome/quinol oxidase subunit 3
MDVSKEGRRGDYTPLIIDGLKGGIILFILREVCFFASFF